MDFIIKGNSVEAFNSMRNLMSRGQFLWFDDPDTPEVESIREIIVKSFKEAVIYLEGPMGDKVDEWKWGPPDVFELGRGNAEGGIERGLLLTLIRIYISPLYSSKSH